MKDKKKKCDIYLKATPMVRQSAKLIMVTADSNKYYNMTELDNGDFKADYARINEASQTAQISMS